MSKDNASPLTYSSANDIKFESKLESQDSLMPSTSSPSFKLENVLSFEAFSPDLIRRVRALKKLQFEKLKVDGELNREIFDLQIKYDNKYAILLDKRRDIVNGIYEPNDEECNFEPDVDQELSFNLKHKLNLNNTKIVKPLKGIPGFWLKCLKSDEEIEEWIESYDVPILLSLKDIRVIRSTNPLKITLNFFFNPNDYFTNDVLTKEYEIEFGPNPSDPWDLEECIVISRKGCEIDWKSGKNVRQKLRKIKKPKKRGFEIVVESVHSFFDFFYPKKEPKMGHKVDDETQDEWFEDWVLAKMFCNSFVSEAVLYLTGDILVHKRYDGTDSSSSYSASTSSVTTVMTSDESNEI